MTSANEWSNAFDLSWNNITSNQAPGLSGYEKSYYLTLAQNELVKNWYIATSKGNNTSTGFDGSPLRQMDFSNLIRTEAQASSVNTPSIDPRALTFNYPNDTVVGIINEQIGFAENAISNFEDATTVRQVIPLSYDEYVRLMSKPFKEPLKRQAWRLQSNDLIEIVLTSEDKKNYKDKGILYVMRYVKKPWPIILEDLSDYGTGITIDGDSKPNNRGICELSESTHEAILQRAVELAKIAWEGDANMIQVQTSSGQRVD